MTLKDYIDTGALFINALVFFLALLGYIGQRNKDRAQSEKEAQLRAEMEEKQLETQKIEIYQRLEMESNNIFRFESEHKDIMPFFREHLPQRNVFDKSASFGPDVPVDEAQLVARKFYENSCNLFEVAARLRRKDIVDHTVFGSWVAWFFDTVTEWGFRATWGDLRDNYTPDLRMIFDEACDQLIREWDIPHAQGQFTDYEPSNDGSESYTVSTERLEAFRVAFYEDMAEKFDCDEIRGWLEEVRRIRIADHPYAYT